MRRSRAALAAAALAIACACSEPPPPEPEAPGGAALVGERAQLLRLLSALARLEGTPLGRRAGELARALPDCPAVEAHAPDADAEALIAALRCRPSSDALHGLTLRWLLDEGGALRARAEVDEHGGVVASFELPVGIASGARALLVPGGEPTGPGVLSGTGALLHARLRPAAGLDLASLVPDGGQGDRMFRLKSELFRGVVLDGTWEAALYLPGMGEPVPRAALALGFSGRSAAIAAIEAFLSELQATWPVRRSAFSHAGAEGACLLDLRILPAFAPCYVATDRALVLGYNPPSLRVALDGEPPELGGRGGLLIDLARIEESDARLAEAAGTALPAGLRHSPWRRLRAEGDAADGSVRVRVVLDPKAGADAKPETHAKAAADAKAGAGA